MVEWPSTLERHYQPRTGMASGVDLRSELGEGMVVVVFGIVPLRSYPCNSPVTQGAL